MGTRAPQKSIGASALASASAARKSTSGSEPTSSTRSSESSASSALSNPVGRSVRHSVTSAFSRLGAKVRNFAPISVLWRTVPGAVLVHDCHTSHEPPRSDRRSPLSRLSPASRGGASCLKKTVSLEEVQPRNSRTRPGQRKPRTPPTDASHADGRVGGGRRPAAHAAAGPRHRCEALLT